MPAFNMIPYPAKAKAKILECETPGFSYGCGNCEYDPLQFAGQSLCMDVFGWNVGSHGSKGPVDSQNDWIFEKQTQSRMLDKEQIC